MTADVYINLLKNKGLPFIKKCAGRGFIFQQDNCSIHVAKKSKKYFEEAKISLLEWPARSPDLNPIENVWEMISRIVYDGPEIKSKQELRQRISIAKDRVVLEKRDVLCEFFSNYHNRLFKLFDKKDAKIDY